MDTCGLIFGRVCALVIVVFSYLSVHSAEQHTQFDTLPSTFHGEDGMEHVVVSGERDDSVESMRRVYNEHKRGMYLYSRGSYEEALPHLLIAAKHGYKDSQARLAHLYLHGLGGVRRSDTTGIGWMGAAANGETTPIIQRRFQELMDAVPPRHTEAIKRVVEEYVAKYGQYEQNVECRVAKHASTLISEKRCYFQYEFAVLSALEIADMQDYYRDKIIPPDQYSSFSMMENFTTPIDPPQNSSQSGGE